MKKTLNFKNEQGFSLIELSIVLIIIGLLVAGVTAGNALIKTAEIRAVAREFEEHKTAVSTFRSTYDALPGDVRDDTLAVSLGSTSGRIGNGDGRIAYTTADANSGSATISEGIEAWLQLSRANMVSGQYTGVTAVGNMNAVIQTNVPQSKLSGAGYFIDFTDFGVGGPRLNVVALGSQDTTGANDTAAMMPIDARNLDRKYDDGKPDFGDIWASNSQNGAPAATATAAAGCTEGTNVGASNSTVKYNLNSTVANPKDKHCILAYVLFR